MIAQADAARVLDLLGALRRVLGAEVAINGGEEALSTTQFLALRALADRDRTVSELARSLGVRLPTLTQLADGLVARSWVDRREDPSDRRRVRLALTESGHEVYRSARKVAEDRMARILSHLSPTEVAALIQGLESLRGALHEVQAEDRERARERS